MFFFYYLINCLITFKHFSEDFLKALLKQILSHPARSLIVYQTRTLFLFFSL
jgi:putative flippase GtrA